MPPCPATPTLVGGSWSLVRTSMLLDPSAWKMLIHSGVLFKFYPGRDAVTMEHRRLNKSQGGHGSASIFVQRRQQAGQMPVNLQFDLFQRKRRVGAILRQHVEADLRVEYGFRQGLEGEQRDGLLLQLVDSGLAALAYGLEDLDHRPPDRAGFLEMREQQRDRDGGRMCDGLNRTLGVEAGWFHHRTRAGATRPNPPARR